MAGANVTIDSAGIREILLSDGVRADLEARAERVAEAARGRNVLVQWPGEPRIPMPYEVSTGISGGARVRARVTAVHPAGMPAEAKYHTLTAALDAAAG